jgi:hypothetical protein
MMRACHRYLGLDKPQGSDGAIFKCVCGV